MIESLRISGGGRNGLGIRLLWAGAIAVKIDYCAFGEELHQLHSLADVPLPRVVGLRIATFFLYLLCWVRLLLIGGCL